MADHLLKPHLPGHGFDSSIFKIVSGQFDGLEYTPSRFRRPAVGKSLSYPVLFQEALSNTGYHQWQDAGLTTLRR